MADDQEKTEEPTPHKLEELRKKGDVPQSKEFANFFVFLGLAVSLMFSAKHMFASIYSVFREAFRFDQRLIESSSELFVTGKEMVDELIWMLVPVFGAVFVCGILAHVGQFGFLFTSQKLIPKFEKLNPINGIKKIFSRDTAIELVKSLTKVIVVTVVMYLIFMSETTNIIEVGSANVPTIFLYSFELIGKLLLALLLFLAVLGLLDLAYQRWSFFQKNKMSFKEVKDELKQREGDPLLKARIRQMQRERARQRMMDEVPHADVVVANPTHVAVAIKYDRGKMNAPKIVAKGVGHIALKIKEIAAEAGVPILEKPQLARYLYRYVEVGDLVPENLYSAVAEVLAYVYKIKKKFRSFQAQPQMA